MRPTLRFGLTLVELLVVIVLLTIITAATLPVMAPAVESRRMREAARGVSVFFSTARSRAIQNGRPVGVEIRRVDYTGVGGTANNHVAVTLFEVEVPTPYVGDDVTTAARVTMNTALDANGIATGTVAVSGPFRGTPFISVGDQVRFEFQGPLYTITGNISSTAFDIQTQRGTVALPWPVGVQSPPATIGTVAVPAMPFQVFRQPRRTSSEPYQLPDGVVIDMTGSGIGPNGLFATFDMMSNVISDPYPVVIMFSPGGAVKSVYQANAAASPPAGDLFLLIGRAEKLPLNHTLKNYNWLDPGCLWATVRHQTGQVNSVAVAPISAASIPTVAPPDSGFPNQMRNSVFESRAFAREGYGEGGR